MLKQLYRVNLVFKYNVTRSVFVKGRNREDAEKRARRRYPSAIRTSRSPFPED